MSILVTLPSGKVLVAHSPRIQPRHFNNRRVQQQVRYRRSAANTKAIINTADHEAAINLIKFILFLPISNNQNL